MNSLRCVLNPFAGCVSVTVGFRVLAQAGDGPAVSNSISSSAKLFIKTVSGEKLTVARMILGVLVMTSSGVLIDWEEAELGSRAQATETIFAPPASKPLNTTVRLSARFPR